MGEWWKTARGATCHWCDDRDTEPTDDIDAEKILCRGHLAEYLGESLAGLDRMEAVQRADMVNLGIIPR